jgi:hypothetical protein
MFVVDIISQPDQPRFYRIGINSLPFGVRTADTSVITTTLPDGTIQTSTIQTVDFKDQYAFTAEVGWRFHDFTGRAGVIESRAGVGLDYDLLKRRLLLSADLYDMSRPNYAAHARIFGRYYISPSVYVTAGWDDFLNRTRQADSMLLGAGVRWGDDNLKYLIGFLGARP